MPDTTYAPSLGPNAYDTSDTPPAPPQQSSPFGMFGPPSDPNATGLLGLSMGTGYGLQNLGGNMVNAAGQRTSFGTLQNPNFLSVLGAGLAATEAQGRAASTQQANLAETQARTLGQQLSNRKSALELPLLQLTTEQQIYFKQHPEELMPYLQKMWGGASGGAGGTATGDQSQPQAQAQTFTGGGSDIAKNDTVAPLVATSSQNNGMPKPLVDALLMQESTYGTNPKAAGNIGQVTFKTAQNPGYGIAPMSGSSDLTDPAKNVEFSVQYLKKAGEAAGVTNWQDPSQWGIALRAYNGTGDPNYVQNVARYLPKGMQVIDPGYRGPAPTTTVAQTPPAPSQPPATQTQPSVQDAPPLNPIAARMAIQRAMTPQLDQSGGALQAPTQLAQSGGGTTSLPAAMPPGAPLDDRGHYYDKNSQQWLPIPTSAPTTTAARTPPPGAVASDVQAIQAGRGATSAPQSLPSPFTSMVAQGNSSGQPTVLTPPPPARSPAAPPPPPPVAAQPPPAQPQASGQPQAADLAAQHFAQAQRYLQTANQVEAQQNAAKWMGLPGPPGDPALLRNLAGQENQKALELQGAGPEEAAKSANSNVSLRGPGAGNVGPTGKVIQSPDVYEALGPDGRKWRLTQNAIETGQPYVRPPGVPEWAPPGTLSAVPAEMSPGESEAMKEAAGDAFGEKARSQYASAIGTKRSMEDMESQIDFLNNSHGAGWYNTGAGGAAKLEIGKIANAALTSIGLPNWFDPAKLAAGEDLMKQTKIAGMTVLSSLQGAQREAAQIITSTQSAVPNIENTPQGDKLVLQSIKEAANWTADQHVFMSNWYFAHNGNMVGADVAFNQNRPSQAYTRRGISMVRPFEVTDPKDFSRFLPGTQVYLKGTDPTKPENIKTVPGNEDLQFQAPQK